MTGRKVGHKMRAAQQIWANFTIVAIIASTTSAMAGTGQVYSCTLDYSVTADGGKIQDWGSWQSLFGAGPGRAMAKSHGKILIDTSADSSEPVRMFGKPSPFKWTTIQNGGGGNSWVLFGAVKEVLQGKGSSWPQLISVQDFDWAQGKGALTGKASIPITFYDELRTLYTGLCDRE
jgi:hypothetical protein